MSSKKNKPNHTSVTNHTITENTTLLTSTQQKTIEYKVAIGNSSEELTAVVNELLKEGWRISGGVAMCIETSPYHSRILMSQALVK